MRAQEVVEQAYGLAGLPVGQRSSKAMWLLDKTTIRIMKGSCYDVPNFVFGGPEPTTEWNQDAVNAQVGLQHHHKSKSDAHTILHMTMKAIKVTSKDVFRHKAISDVIRKQWFGPKQKHFTANMSSEKFRSVPDNMICFVCNAVSATISPKAALH